MFEIVFHDRAKKTYERLPDKAARLIDHGIVTLLINPIRDPNIKRLHGELEGCFRLRIGDYRLVYQIDWRKRIIIILALGPRGNIY